MKYHTLTNYIAPSRNLYPLLAVTPRRQAAPWSKVGVSLASAAAAALQAFAPRRGWLLSPLDQYAISLNQVVQANRMKLTDKIYRWSIHLKDECSSGG